MDKLQRTASCTRYQAMLNAKELPAFSLRRYSSDDFDFQALVEDGFDFPFIVEGTSSHFGLELPPRNWTLQDVAEVVGSYVPVRLIDVSSQSELQGYTISQYAEYLEKNRFGGDSYNSARILNMISLEVSNSSLSDYVVAPKFVTSLDWVNLYWPLERIARNDYPRVQKYCLAGMAGSYTDFHIDFGGSGVWYHILWGKKRFYLIPPTEENLKVYENWTSSKDQAGTFLGDLVPGECFTLDLIPNETLIIPSGWIHSVLTPDDSLVFGGNFLTSFSIIPQIQSFEIESRTKIDEIYMFPYFRQINFCFLLDIFNKSKVEEIGKLLPRKILLQLPVALKACEKWRKERKFKSIFDPFLKNEQPAQKVIDDLWVLISSLDCMKQIDLDTFRDEDSDDTHWRHILLDLTRSTPYREYLKSHPTKTKVEENSDDSEYEESENLLERKSRKRAIKTGGEGNEEKIRKKQSIRGSSRNRLWSICSRTKKK